MLQDLFEKYEKTTRNLSVQGFLFSFHIFSHSSGRKFIPGSSQSEFVLHLHDQYKGTKLRKNYPVKQETIMFQINILQNNAQLKLQE